MDDKEKAEFEVETKVVLAEIKKDILNLTNTVSDGLKADIIYIRDVLAEIMPLIKDNTYWVGKWKQAIYYIAIMAVGGGLVATAFYLLRNINT